MATRNLRVGSRGEDVKEIQRTLGITADGIFGPQTQRAVKDFQRENNLSVDGIVGPNTINSLSKTGSNVEQQIKDFRSGKTNVASSTPFVSRIPEKEEPKKKAPVPVPVRDTQPPVPQAGNTFTTPTAPQTQHTTPQQPQASNSDDVLLSEVIKRNQDSYNILTPEMQTIVNELSNVLNKTIESGKVINPNIEFTPTEVSQFLDQATQELDPFFQEQIGQIREDLDTSISRLTQDFERGVSEAEEPFTQGLKDQSEQEAQSGLAFSSERNRRQGRALTEQQQRLDSAERGVGRNIEDLARGTERRIGSSEFGRTSIPNLSKFKATSGGFQRVGSRTLFTPDGQLKGTLGKEQEVALGTRAKELEGAERKRRILNTSDL